MNDTVTTLLAIRGIITPTPLGAVDKYGIEAVNIDRLVNGIMILNKYLPEKAGVYLEELLLDNLSKSDAPSSLDEVEWLYNLIDSSITEGGGDVSTTPEVGQVLSMIAYILRNRACREDGDDALRTLMWVEYWLSPILKSQAVLDLPLAKLAGELVAGANSGEIVEEASAGYLCDLVDTLNYLLIQLEDKY